VLHDLTLAAHYCHRLQLLYEGATLAAGAPQEVLNEENLADAYGIELMEPEMGLTSPFALPWRRLAE
jgi:iron complex transport system ATP-binding protein